MGGQKIKNKNKTSHPHFLGVVHILGLSTVLLDIWREKSLCLPFLSDWTIKSSIPLSIKTTQPPQKSNLALQEHPPFSSDGDFPVSHDVKPQFMYIQCEAPKIAKLVYNSNNYGLWYL